MNTLQSAQICGVLDMLHTKKINYVSLNVFENNKPILFKCNHEEWLHYYEANYGTNDSPVQKYILHSGLRVLFWDLFDLDKQTKDYIQKRNEIVSVKTNISLLYRKNKQLVALTCGSKMRQQYLINFLTKHIECLSLIIKEYIL